MIMLKSSCIMVSVLSSARLISSAFFTCCTPIFFFFLRQSMGAVTSFLVNSGDVSVLLIVFNVVVGMVTSVFQSCFAALTVFRFIVLS